MQSGDKTNDRPLIGLTLNRLAREKMKYKIMRDVMADMTVCEIEGWNMTEYLDELVKLINELRYGR